MSSTPSSLLSLPPPTEVSRRAHVGRKVQRMQQQDHIRRVLRQCWRTGLRDRDRKRVVLVLGRVGEAWTVGWVGRGGWGVVRTHRENSAVKLKLGGLGWVEEEGRSWKLEVGRDSTGRRKTSDEGDRYISVLVNVRRKEET